MTKAITLDQTSKALTSVEWLDQAIEFDPSFILHPELVPAKTSQAMIQPLVEDALVRLFSFGPPNTWAGFAPFAGYFFYLRRLFRSRILSSFEPEFALETLDNIFEGNQEIPEEEGEKIYEMLDTLRHLDDILDAIYLRIRSCMKS